jgi:hypothetical protein
MARHRTEAELPPQTIQNADLTFRVWSDDEVLGTLALSKGTIDWWPGKAKKPIRLGWEQFARMMEDR